MTVLIRAIVVSLRDARVVRNRGLDGQEAFAGHLLHPHKKFGDEGGVHAMEIARLQGFLIRVFGGDDIHVGQARVDPEQMFGRRVPPRACFSM